MFLSSLVRSAIVVLGIVLCGASAHAQFGGGAPGGGQQGGMPQVHVDSNKPAVVHQRTLEGYVRDANDKGVQGVVVYLKNVRKDTVESIIADDHGAYRFGDLRNDTDYKLWAVQEKKKGPERTVSQYDTRDQIVMNLKME
jgi:hypothetical protein